MDFLIPESTSGPGSSETVFAVSDLNRRIRDLLVEEIGQVWVRGEVSNLKVHSSGHCYFTLRDSESQIDMVLFRRDAERVSITPRNGSQLLVHGAIDLYLPHGKHKLIVRAILDDGVGRLQREFEKLKARLREEGLFDPARRRPVPSLPRCIALVTSPTGAAIRDVISVFRCRAWSGHLLVFPCRVQGAGAASEIAAAIADANAFPGVDLLVVGRGGGSLEDLWPFNEEAVVRAVAASAKPVISAVGHETDTVLCDFAADLRAETPTGAAELVTREAARFREEVMGCRDRLDRVLEEGLRDRRERLAGASLAVRPATLTQRLEGLAMRLDDGESRLELAVRRACERRREAVRSHFSRFSGGSLEQAVRAARRHLQGMGGRIDRGVSLAVGRAATSLGGISVRLKASGIEGTLGRGFALARRSDGTIVRRADQLREGQLLDLRFLDGSRQVRVESRPDESPPMDADG